MKKGAIIFIAVALALLAISGGCGGGSDETSSAPNTSSTSTTSSTPTTNSSPTTSSAPSRSEFIAQVDAVCKTGKARIESGTAKFVKAHKVNTASPTKAQNESVLSEVTGPDLQRQAEDIAALEVPAGDEAKVEALVSAIEDGADELEQNPGAVIQGKDPFTQAVRLAEEYGIKGCSN
jgi:maltose-binding protein MalE